MKFTGLGTALRARIASRRLITTPTASTTDAQRLVDLEREAGAAAPDGCEWLDDTTIADLELADIAKHLDRTASAVGAQHFWRWFAAPANRVAVLDDREHALAALDPSKREPLRRELARLADPDVAYIPLLLWRTMPGLTTSLLQLRLRAFALVACLALSLVSRWAIFPFVALFLVNTLLDAAIDTVQSRQVRALAMFGLLMRVSSRIHAHGLAPPGTSAQIDEELKALLPLRGRLGWLGRRPMTTTIGFPDVLGILRAALLIRVIAFSRCLGDLELQRDRMRTLHRLVGELDALQSLQTLRAERSDIFVPQLHEGDAELHVTDLRHPSITGAVGNDLDASAGSLIITGSNMSGKSTFLRAIAVNAVLAQSIHTTFGQWRGSTFRVLAAMRAIDATGDGISTYAAVVASIGRLIAGAQTSSPPALFVVDEPFRGTNPAVRVPIVVAVLEYLAKGHSLFAATHDLDVANRLSNKFARDVLNRSSQHSMKNIRGSLKVQRLARALVESACDSV